MFSKLWPLLLVLLVTCNVQAKDYIIYSVVQDLPMGEKDEILKKNYYLNMGKDQGVKSGTVLDVFRIVSRVDPYDSNKRYKYTIKVGELEVIHTEKSAAIANKVTFVDSIKSPLLSLKDFLVGDVVRINLKK